jgi:RNA recognition motif-containing protein
MESEHGVSVAHDSSKDNRTVFVSNLDYSVSDDAIREIFSSMGSITDLRLVKDFKGRFKGYCYVEFSSPVCNLLLSCACMCVDRSIYTCVFYTLYYIYVTG